MEYTLPNVSPKYSDEPSAAIAVRTSPEAWKVQRSQPVCALSACTSPLWPPTNSQSPTTVG
jgi:hypothetical protein